MHMAIKQWGILKQFEVTHFGTVRSFSPWKKKQTKKKTELRGKSYKFTNLTADLDPSKQTKVWKDPEGGFFKFKYGAEVHVSFS